MTATHALRIPGARRAALAADRHSAARHSIKRVQLHNKSLWGAR